jgi:hypothetical protein
MRVHIVLRICITHPGTEQYSPLYTFQCTTRQSGDNCRLAPVGLVVQFQRPRGHATTGTVGGSGADLIVRSVRVQT